MYQEVRLQNHLTHFQVCNPARIMNGAYAATVQMVCTATGLIMPVSTRRVTLAALLHGHPLLISHHQELLSVGLQ